MSIIFDPATSIEIASDPKETLLGNSSAFRRSFVW